MENLSTFGGNVEDRVLEVTQSESLTEAHRKLTEARREVCEGTTGTIAGVEPWETQSAALQRLDQEIRVIEELMIDEFLDEAV